jgi:DNA-binding XRE family transcriptional regulator
MAPPSDQTARHRQRLAVLVAQRRAQLKLKKEDAAKVCDIAYMTYWKIEDGQSVRPSTYSKLEVGFNFRAGSCKAVLEGATDSVVLEDGTELIEGGQIRDFIDPERLEEIGAQALTTSAGLYAPGLTLEQTNAIYEGFMEELRRRGVMPKKP